MKGLKLPVQITLMLCLLLGAEAANATDISGTISSTLTIFDNSELTGKVTCTVSGPCIVFGADNITLRLNGFTITGLADPILGCGPTSATTHGGEIGIDTAGHSHLQILGPGLVQNFRGIGVILRSGSTKDRVTHITTSTNCVCGILVLGGAADNDIEENVVARVGNFTSPCGGINASGDNNRVRRNEVNGNGYVLGPTVSSLNNDFGIEVGGSENLIEENSAVGNTNGIRLVSAATGNVVRRNIFTGNPPIQLSETFGAFGGVDILDVSPATADRNIFEDNLCLTSNVSGLCPHIPNFAGHKNTDEGER